MQKRNVSDDVILRIYKRYFDMIKRGVKTLEVRVAYERLKRVGPGDVIRFNADPMCRRKVLRVARYASFKEMMENEDPRKINPYDSADKQLADIAKFYPREKERLGILVFELGPV